MNEADVLNLAKKVAEIQTPSNASDWGVLGILLLVLIACVIILWRWSSTMLSKLLEAKDAMATVVSANTQAFNNVASESKLTRETMEDMKKVFDQINFLKEVRGSPFHRDNTHG